MNNTADLIMIFLVLTNLMLLGLSRMGACIRIVALQGVVLSFLPLILNQWNFEMHLVLFSIVIISLKGGVFPWMLNRTLRELSIQREIEPFIGYGISIIAGTIAFLTCMWLSHRLPFPQPLMSPLIVPVAFFTIMSGLFLIISRKKALTQVLGYLVLENGIYAFGVALVKQQPMLVEIGVLLDIFVAVFVMGIAIFHINREFDHIDTDQLSRLRS